MEIFLNEDHSPAAWCKLQKDNGVCVKKLTVGGEIGKGLEWLTKISELPNSLCSLYLKNLPCLKVLEIADLPNIKELTIEGCCALGDFVLPKNLFKLYISQSPQCLPVTAGNSLEKIVLKGLRIKEPALGQLIAHQKRLQKLDLSQCTRLKTVPPVSGDALVSLVAVGCPILCKVEINTPIIKEIDLSDCPQLKVIGRLPLSLSKLNLKGSGQVSRIEGIAIPAILHRLEDPSHTIEAARFLIDRPLDTLLCHSDLYILGSPGSGSQALQKRIIRYGGGNVPKGSSLDVRLAQIKIEEVTLRVWHPGWRALRRRMDPIFHRRKGVTIFVISSAPKTSTPSGLAEEEWDDLMVQRDLEDWIDTLLSVNPNGQFAIVCVDGRGCGRDSCLRLVRKSMGKFANKSKGRFLYNPSKIFIQGSGSEDLDELFIWLRGAVRAFLIEQGGRVPRELVEAATKAHACHSREDTWIFPLNHSAGRGWADRLGPISSASPKILTVLLEALGILEIRKSGERAFVLCDPRWAVSAINRFLEHNSSIFRDKSNLMSEFTIASGGHAELLAVEMKHWDGFQHLRTQAAWISLWSVMPTWQEVEEKLQTKWRNYRKATPEGIVTIHQAILCPPDGFYTELDFFHFIGAIVESFRRNPVMWRYGAQFILSRSDVVSGCFVKVPEGLFLRIDWLPRRSDQSSGGYTTRGAIRVQMGTPGPDARNRNTELVLDHLVGLLREMVGKVSVLEDEREIDRSYPDEPSVDRLVHYKFAISNRSQDTEATAALLKNMILNNEMGSVYWYRDEGIDKGGKMVKTWNTEEVFERIGTAQVVIILASPSYFEKSEHNRYCAIEFANTVINLAAKKISAIIIRDKNLGENDIVSDSVDFLKEMAKIYNKKWSDGNSLWHQKLRNLFEEGVRSIPNVAETLLNPDQVFWLSSATDLEGFQQILEKLRSFDEREFFGSLS